MAVFGLRRLYGDKSHSVNSQVMEIRPHCRYDTRSNVNDIALLKLSQVITYNDYIQPICLPSTPLLLSDRNPCYISGWGLTKENGTPSYILQEAEIKVFPLKVCNSYDWYNGRLSRNQLCAGSESGHVDTCLGDSGGPLMCYLPDDGKFYLVGITSYGIGCGRPKLPGIYIHTAKYRSWIDSRLRGKTSIVSIPCVLIFSAVVWVTMHLVLWLGERSSPSSLVAGSRDSLIDPRQETPAPRNKRSNRRAKFPRRTMRRSRRRAAAAPLLALVLGQAVTLNLTSLLPSEDCGTRPLMGEMTEWNRIVGGRDAEPGAWPWQVSLQVYRFGTGYHHICGGSVINNYSVLTAAHCIKKWTDPAFWRVVFGLHHLYNYESSTVKRHVRAIVMHSGFKRSTYENDVALFKLKRPISYSNYIQPICLPNSTTQLVADENPCFISGWGNTEEKGRGKFILQEAQVDVIPLYICNRYDWYAGVVSWNMLCAGSETGHVDSCQGDSGGPLVCYFPDYTKFYLIGITSFGVGCGRPKLPGIYIRAKNYRPWIDKAVAIFSRTSTMSIRHILMFLTIGLVTFHLVL
ncbi:transmembrane protease serine 12-like [Lacerta agilis]|uniref:transmembrane protease serine 12-like n=1 Tax=Lacerta agilis TaxID=80427 RepID=UPI00141A165B|nr:transmembrane protease serine 12-like [Lacerta agilis]